LPFNASAGILDRLFAPQARRPTTAPSPGRHTLVVRATDGRGSLQTSVEQEPSPDGAAGLHEITVTVEA
jgi:hypothetical protein